MVLMKLLYLLTSLDYNGASRQVRMLGQAFAGTCELRVCVLQTEGAWAAPLRTAGIPVESLEWSRPLDPLPLWRLHRLLREFEPDCIHVWRWPALRSLALAGRKYLSRCIVSQFVRCKRRERELNKLDCWLLQQVNIIIASSSREAETLARLGYDTRKVQMIRPAVESHAPNRRLESAAFARGSDGNCRRIVCVGNMEAHKGFRQACQAADFLSYPFADLQLSLIGSGPYLPSLQRFQRSVFHRDRIRFLGARPDAAECLAEADVCWVPSLTATGCQVALEAMAAARPVIAPDLAPFREIIEDGVTGLLIPPGDLMALIRRTRELFVNPNLARQLGEAARTRVKKNFPAVDFIDKFRALYSAGQRNSFPQNECNARTC
jgi:glycosyltransferase involved in cell wall biosynthesis